MLLSSNCSVILADLALRPEASSLVSQYSEERTSQRPQAIFQKTDVTSWDQLEALFRQANEKFQGVDIVCPGAGIFEPKFSNFWYPPGAGSKEAADKLEDSRYKTLDINLTHPIRCTQTAISHFLSRFPPGSDLPEGRKSRGVVVHISSVAAQAAPLFCPLYSASKAGLSHFVRAFDTLEPHLGIRVVAVAPGIIKTPMWTEDSDKSKMFVESADEWVTPEEVAEVMLDCVQSSDKPGGTIWEVGKSVRKVEVLNDPGPSGRGIKVGKIGLGYEDVFGLLQGKGWGK
ncbi:MAG: hypothetical protein M1816_006150 [Peltula sp. TS41687]|nr:MAG: hypothetical protein M1816_006150 [Peltula sp. TS41687]